MKKILIIFLIPILSVMQQVIAAEPSETDVLVNSLYAANKLDDAFNQIIKVPNYERTAQQWLIMGNIMLDYNRNEDAEFMYKSAISKDAKFYKAYYNLGNIYLAYNQTNMAIDNYKLALKYNKEFAPAYYNLGCAYLKLGEFKKAKNAFHDAIYFKPNVADYHYNLAYTYKALGKNKDAQTYLDYYNKLQNGY